VSAVLNRDDYFATWSKLHGGYDPRRSRLTGGWLSLVYVIARPVATRRVPPDVLTVVGMLAAVSVAALAGIGGRWVSLAAFAAVLTGLLDGLDGAVAVLTGRATRWGYVIDSVADRVADALFMLALWLAGASAWVCVAAGAVTGLLEYTRARATAAGMTEIGVVTVWERPTRVIVTALFLLGVAVYDDGGWAQWGARASLTLGLVGLVQLLIVVRRRLR
jgi:phosphatidylglycerophosphate synthase